MAGRRDLRTAGAMMFAAFASACVSAPDPAGRTFVIPTGAELTLPPGASLQAMCMFHEIDEDITPEISACVEYPDDLAARTGVDPVQSLSNQLTALGYVRTGGSETVSWFRTPLPPGCVQSLNLVSVPKAAPESGGAKTLVAAFVAEPKRCS